ncbi:transporter substrate-binding domain-containing protein [Campylobacter hyointestinalis]|uniref:Transporter substrate-binding domain-containing protein n=1 Tax=Campylobacter hyointestinalis TaxID=198 RepID=A0A562XC92_CAMHY|nr:transporter substrate-binding domain-containing protein [Campylobacter hyointestinalis]ANE34104.1 amino acid ABC transporter, periplasmic cysteine-binding protein [Campylobacter hyointestinalis subsp. lawsonii CCUG 27631]TWO19749.1 transporter substrate-binding domain-containing protein [Campylobacter hyointestinalis]
MKKILGLIFALFIFAGCQSADTKDNNKTILRIGTEGTYAPFTYHDTTGKLVGYDVDVITEAAIRAGFKPEFFETNWDAIFSGLNSGRFDMIANQISDNNPKRAELYTLSIPYIVTSAAVAIRSDNENIKELKDINGTKIAQAIGSAYYDTAVANGAQIVLVDNLAPALKAVSQGRADGTMNDKLAILNYLKTTNDKNVKIAFTTGDGTRSVFLFKKELTDARDKINLALESMKKDGTLKKISERYFGVDVSE